MTLAKTQKQAFMEAQSVISRRLDKMAIPRPLLNFGKSLYVLIYTQIPLNNKVVDEYFATFADNFFSASRHVSPQKFSRIFLILIAANIFSLENRHT